MPAAPRATWRLPSCTHLCVLTCGRSATPRVVARSAMWARLRSTTSRGRSRAGVSRSPWAGDFLAIEPAVVDLDLPDVHDAARPAHERGSEPAGESDDQGAQRRGAEPRDAEPRHQPGHDL